MLEGEKQNGARDVVLLPRVVFLFFPVCVCVRVSTMTRAQFCVCVSAAEAKKTPRRRRRSSVTGLSVSRSYQYIDTRFVLTADGSLLLFVLLFDDARNVFNELSWTRVCKV